MYAELSYFEGYAFQHIAARDEHLRLQRIRTNALRALDRRRSAR